MKRNKVDIISRIKHFVEIGCVWLEFWDEQNTDLMFKLDFQLIHIIILSWVFIRSVTQGSTVELKLNRTYITCTYSRAGLIILTILYPCRPNFNIQENIYDRLLKKFICCKKCTHTIIWNFIPLHAKIATHAKFEYIDVAWEIFWSFKIKKVLKFSFPEETKGHNK